MKNHSCVLCPPEILFKKPSNVHLIYFLLVWTIFQFPFDAILIYYSDYYHLLNSLIRRNYYYYCCYNYFYYSQVEVWVGCDIQYHILVIAAVFLDSRLQNLYLIIQDMARDQKILQALSNFEDNKLTVDFGCKMVIVVVVARDSVFDTNYNFEIPIIISLRFPGFSYNDFVGLLKIFD